MFFGRFVWWFHCFPLVALNAFSSSPITPSAPEIMPRGFVQLTNPIGGGADQSLPASFVRDWPTWILDLDGSLSKIPDDDGFVQPASIDELWQPVDLKKPELRLALGLHVREGVVRHVMPAVDLCYGDGLHRNRGICTAPRAHTWIDFTQLSLDEWDKYTISLAQKKTGDDSWTALSATSSPSSISGAIERGMLCLADAPDALGEGSHIVNVLFSSTNNEETTGMVECPGVGHAMRVTMDDNVIFNIAGPENDAQGVLQVAISSSMAGSESEFLPEVYKELFQDESLKNPLYVRFKKRQEERLANKNNE